MLILSGDHIYKMDYGKMLEFHKDSNADCTIAVLEVPWEEASRFGIMTADENNVITKFEEKPKEPKSNLASMGIYIFTWEKLRKYLTEDEADKTSSNDFGKNIIPNMLADQQRMVAYPFEGYWKDVGTIDSLWEANMDLLDPNVPLDVWDPEWKIYSRTSGRPGHYIGTGALVDNAMLTEAARWKHRCKQRSVCRGRVEKDAMVESTILMPGAVVEEGARCIIPSSPKTSPLKRAPSWAHGPKMWRINPNGASPLWAKVSPSVKTPRWGRRRCWKKTYRTVRIYGKHQRAGDHFPQYL